jgi:hypothetical protein
MAYSTAKLRSREDKYKLLCTNVNYKCVRDVSQTMPRNCKYFCKREILFDTMRQDGGIKNKMYNGTIC